MKKIAIFSIFVLMIPTLLFFSAHAVTFEFQKTIAANYANNFVITKDGSLYCFEENSLRDHSKHQASECVEPTKLLEDVKGVYASWHSAFAIKTDNSLWELEDEQGEERDEWKATKLMDGVMGVAGSYDRWMALKLDGTVWEWDHYNNKIPQKVNISNVRQISAGIDAFYAVTNLNTLWGWRNNYSGELGVKTGNTFMYSPIAIMTDVKYVHGSGMSAFAIKTDGSLWGWGDNDDGLIFTGSDETWTFDPYEDGSQSTVTSHFTPSKLMDNIIKVSGKNDMAVIKTDHSLWAWGRDGEGMNSDGTVTPLKILEDVVDVSTDFSNTLALKKDGSLWERGDRLSYGELNTHHFDYETWFDFEKIMDNIAIPESMGHIPSAWAKEEVAKAVEEGLVPESLQSYYEKDITRKDFVALIAQVVFKTTGLDLASLAQENNNAARVVFIDTNDPDVLNAAKLGIVHGIGNNRFHPNGILTREQAAKILTQTAKLLGLGSTETKFTFADHNNISKWAVDEVYYCYANGIMNGTGKNCFSPAKSFAREMSIVTLDRLYEMCKK